MIRTAMLKESESRREPWDIVVVGGGATGIGIAVDAATRGYSVLLFEAHDFGKGTSSRSTKLVHGGVRYLRNGQISLVREALEERGLMRRNAPHLVSDLGFIVPFYRSLDAPFYGIGLKLYDWMAGRYGFGATEFLTRSETIMRLPGVRTSGLRGAVLYHDGQFDDSRLLIHLARTAATNGAILLNYAPVTGFTAAASGRIDGVLARDAESGAEIHVQARSVINAAGPFCDEIRRLADESTPNLVAASQGSHIVVRSEFLPGPNALMVPKTSDGRVLFGIPWHGHTVIGTTDTPIPKASAEPTPLPQEIDFILDTAGECMERPPSRSDVLSTFAGIRPLVLQGAGKNTAALSRDHIIRIDSSGLLNILGGKWTTYRHMAEDCVDQAVSLAKLPASRCRTKELRIHGYDENAGRHGHLSVHGADAQAIVNLAMPELLHPDLPYIRAEVIWSVRCEMARTVEDVLARRTRALFLNAAAASEAASEVAALMAPELGWSAEQQQREVDEFRRLARGYGL